MPKNIKAHIYELKKVEIKWPQLVGDKDIHRKHTQTITLMQSVL
jgi:hypothetical protein